MSDYDQIDDTADPLLEAAISSVMLEAAPPGPPMAVRIRLSQQLQPPANRIRAKSSAPMWRYLLVAASILVICSVAWQSSQSRGNLWAEVAKEFQHAKSIQFRRIHYVHQFADENETIARRARSVEDSYFKSPGYRREIQFDEHGIPWKIETENAVHGTILKLNLAQKEATLIESTPPTEFELKQGISSNLVMIEDWLKHGKVIQNLGQKMIQGHDATGLRVAHVDRKADFWIDRQSRRIVRFLEPTAEEYDPDADAIPEKFPDGSNSLSGQKLKGWMWTDIVYDAPLDDALFVISVPTGFQLKKIVYRNPSESDLKAWLEVFARINGGKFTDDENPPNALWEQRDTIAQKPVNDLLPWEVTVRNDKIDPESAVDSRKALLKSGGHSVLVWFWMNYRDSWHYQGKDVRLGDASSAVCWYRPTGSTTFRVIYGDLSIKDVSSKDLPAKR